VIELLVLVGLLALVLLAVVAVLFVLHQRRQGTVRAVFMPVTRTTTRPPPLHDPPGRATELMGLPVVTLDTAAAVGEVRDVLFDPHGRAWSPSRFVAVAFSRRR
jgi:hypothetical protein